MDSGRYRNLMWLAGLIYLIGAVCSIGYIHPDEHFQILEFAHAKLGKADAANLAWEYEARIRPMLQPVIAMAVISAADLIGLSNPFTQALLLRLLTAAFVLALLWRLNSLLVQDFSSERAGLFLFAGSLLLWVQPYIFTHFSSETLSTLFLLSAILIVLRSHASKDGGRLISGIAAGLLLAAAFNARFQVGFSILGLALWLLFVARPGWSYLLAVGFSALLGLGLGVLIDSAMYGNWEIAAYNYFTANIVDNVAANWGTKPWWAYFPMFFNAVIHPYALLLLGLAILSIRKRPTSIWLFVLLPFLIGHMAVGHKEIRFLIPLLYPLIVLAAYGVDTLGDWRPVLVKRVFILLAVVNTLLLTYRVLMPAQEAMLYQRFVYKATQKEALPLVCVAESPYQVVGIESSFYKPEALEISLVESEEALADFMAKHKIERALIFRKNHLVDEVEGYTQERQFTLFPEWVLRNNSNDWQSRARIWSIYEAKAE